MLEDRYGEALGEIMEKIIQKMTVKKIMFGFYFICAFIFSCILFLGFWNQQANIIRQNDISFENLIEQMTQSIKDKCELYNNMLTQMAYMQSTQTWLEGGMTEYGTIEDEIMMEYLRNYISLDDTIIDVALFSADGRRINFSADIIKIGEACAEIPEKVPYYYTGVKEINISLSYPRVKECILLGTRVYSMTTYDRENPIGTMVLVLDAEKLMGVEGGEEFGTVRSFAFDRNHEPFCNDEEPLAEGLTWKEIRQSSEKPNGKIVLNNSAYSVRTGEIPYLQGLAVLMISEKDLLRNVYQFGRNQIILFLFALILEIPIFLALSKCITNPILELVEFFSKNRNNGVTVLKQRVNCRGIREIRILGNNINGMLEEMDQMTHRLVDTTMRLYEAKVEKKQAELEYLYAQINPHFLFNTLESIKGCAVTEEAWKSFKMLDALGKVFRYSVNLAAEVSLEDEIKLVKNYFYIQKMRFGDKLEYEIELPEELMQFRIPKMILQPLAENAVVHGIEESERGGRIEIKGSFTQKFIYLSIDNSGEIISREKFRQINEVKCTGVRKDENGRKTTHIGLYNVNNRLVHTYGKKSGVFIRPKKTGGLQVIIRISREQMGDNNV